MLYLAPGKMVLYAVYGKGDQLHVPLGKFRSQLGSSAQLRGAHRREVPRVGEENAPPARKGERSPMSEKVIANSGENEQPQTPYQKQLSFKSECV